ncbi:hypothetical protein B0H14DRAFT_3132934 [Mycena olivaceomarginata]|nr:hypothetical protein B0H14DRAFT_3132934 [Mycena olivaceomarginata]
MRYDLVLETTQHQPDSRRTHLWQYDGGEHVGIVPKSYWRWRSMTRANGAGGEIKGGVRQSFPTEEQPITTQNNIVRQSGGRVRIPEATEPGAEMPADKIQLRDTRDVAEEESTEVERGMLQNVAEGAIE